MMNVGNPFRRAAIFGASGGIGAALATRLAESGIEVWAGSRSGAAADPALRAFRFDLSDEASIAAAAGAMADAPPDLVVVASGVLTLADGSGPERSYKQIDGAAMDEVFRLNTIGPALVAKHMLPLLPRDRRSVFAALSARVGSIGDNRIGGWISYRSAKAAVNQIVHTAAIELTRSHKNSICVALHPGTVKTAFTAKYLARHPAVAPSEAAENLLAVIDGLTPADTGQFFDWAGKPVPW